MEFNNDFSSGFCSHEKYYSVPLVIDKSLRDRDYNTSWLILEIQSMVCRRLHLHYLHPMVKIIFYWIGFVRIYLYMISHKFGYNNLNNKDCSNSKAKECNWITKWTISYFWVTDILFWSRRWSRACWVNTLAMCSPGWAWNNFNQTLIITGYMIHVF